MENIVLPIIVKHRGAVKNHVLVKKEIDKVIEGIAFKFEAKNTVFMACFNGPRFPQEDEFTKFKELCEVIRDSYFAFDPLDKHNKGFDGMDREC